MRSIEDISGLILNVPRQSVKLLLVCLAGVLVFVFGGLAPAYWNNAHLDQKIADTRRQIEDTKALQPLFLSLQKVPKIASPSLSIPSRVAMQRSAVEGINASFREIAGRNGMKVVSIVTNLVPAGKSQLLVVNVSLRGEFENFRGVLKTFGELPHLDHIEEYTIHRSSSSRALDISTQVVLALR